MEQTGGHAENLLSKLRRFLVFYISYLCNILIYYFLAQVTMKTFTGLTR